MASERPKAPKCKKRRHGRHASKPLAPRRTRQTKEEEEKKKKKRSNSNLVPLGTNSVWAERKKEAKEKKRREADQDTVLLSTAPAAQQLRFFLDRFQSANGLRLSPLELEAFKDSCIVELSQTIDQDVDNFSKHVKVIFGESWKEVLCEGKLSEGAIDAGSPAILIITTSALRSLQLVRGLKEFTQECRPAKLFAKHMKVEEQVSLLKGRTNIAGGTPSRIMKLIDVDALLLSRLAIVVLDMHRDAKGYSLFTLPQVSVEFWDLYNRYFHRRLLQGNTRICFYGPVPQVELEKVVQNDR